MKHSVWFTLVLVITALLGVIIPGNSTPATITLTPYSPAIGQEVFVSGEGFDPNGGEVYLYLVDSYGYWNDIDRIGTDWFDVNRRGEISGSFYTPVYYPDDEYYIFAEQADTGITASHMFDIVWITIVATPTEGKPGNYVTIEGYGFGQGMANQLFSLYFDDIPLFINQYTDGSRIQFTRFFHVPDVVPGVHTIQAIDHYYGLSTNAYFTVKGKDPGYELFIEIDYIEGHRPSAFTESYIESYYEKRGIDLDIIIDDEIPLESSVMDGISVDEYWAYEAEYNDLIYFDDRKGLLKVTDVPEKWVLYGNWWSDKGFNVYGQCDYNPWSLTECGNYMFIADEANDFWVNYWSGVDKSWKRITEDQMETSLLMHEIGHSIGIIDVDWVGIPPYPEEVYDTHSWSVMSYVNAKSCNALRYSNEYWNMKDMQFYTK